MGFMFSPSGNCCDCDPTTTLVCFTVTGACGSDSAAFAGATITLKDSGGSTVGTCTTDSSGQCCIGVTKKGTYSAVITGYATSTVTGIVVATCGGTVNVGPIVLPTPATLTLTDVNTTITLFWNSSRGSWVGCYAISLGGGTTSSGPDPTTGEITCVVGTVSACVAYELGCSGAVRAFTLENGISAFFQSCSFGPTTFTYAPATCVSSGFARGTVSISQPGTSVLPRGDRPSGSVSPFNLTFTNVGPYQATDPFGTTYTLPNPSAGGVTITL